jgi:hypothetical protein
VARRRKGQMQKRALCTYCGEAKKLTDDHVFPRCLWVGESTERSIKVRSCADCNNRSDESLLKSFLAMFDRRLADERVQELTHPLGRGDLTKFLRACTPDFSKVYPDDHVTRPLRKLFMGLRRNLLKDQWRFIPPDYFYLLAHYMEGGERIMRPLPLKVGERNVGFTFPSELEDIFQSYRFHFRGLDFDLPEPGVFTLHFKRPESENELTLVCWVQDEVRMVTSTGNMSTG